VSTVVSNEGDSIYGSPARALSDLFSRANALEQVLVCLNGEERAIACASPCAYPAVEDYNSDSIPFSIDEILYLTHVVNWIASHLEPRWIVDWRSSPSPYLGIPH